MSAIQSSSSSSSSFSSSSIYSCHFCIPTFETTTHLSILQNDIHINETLMYSFTVVISNYIIIIGYHMPLCHEILKTCFCICLDFQECVLSSKSSSYVGLSWLAMICRYLTQSFAPQTSAPTVKKYYTDIRSLWILARCSGPQMTGRVDIFVLLSVVYGIIFTRTGHRID